MIATVQGGADPLDDDAVVALSAWAHGPPTVGAICGGERHAEVHRTLHAEVCAGA